MLNLLNVLGVAKTYATNSTSFELYIQIYEKSLRKPILVAIFNRQSNSYMLFLMLKDCELSK